MILIRERNAQQLNESLLNKIQKFTVYSTNNDKITINRGIGNLFTYVRRLERENSPFIVIGKTKNEPGIISNEAIIPDNFIILTEISQDHYFNTPQIRKIDVDEIIKEFIIRRTDEQTEDDVMGLFNDLTVLSPNDSLVFLKYNGDIINADPMSGKYIGANGLIWISDSSINIDENDVIINIDKNDEILDVDIIDDRSKSVYKSLSPNDIIDKYFNGYLIKVIDIKSFSEDDLFYLNKTAPEISAQLILTGEAAICVEGVDDDCNYEYELEKIKNKYIFFPCYSCNDEFSADEMEEFEENGKSFLICEKCLESLYTT